MENCVCELTQVGGLSEGLWIIRRFWAPLAESLAWLEQEESGSHHEKSESRG